VGVSTYETQRHKDGIKIEGERRSDVVLFWVSIYVRIDHSKHTTLALWRAAAFSSSSP